jgi:hypothetical protein
MALPVGPDLNPKGSIAKEAKAEKSIGAGSKHPKTDPYKKGHEVVDKRIGRDGEYVKSAIDSLKNLDKIQGMMNPTAIAAIGGFGILSSIISQISACFGGGDDGGEDEPKQIDCSIQNRPNLTPEELAWCELLDEQQQTREETNGQ